MEYNSQRNRLIIPEYGRNVQKMIEFACTIEDRDERNRIAQAIIEVMGQLNPHFRDVADFTHKLWAHLFIISDFKLDVDSPYPKPEKEKLFSRPKKMEYPQKQIRFKHYGHTIELLIEKAKTVKEPEEREAFVQTLANLMKKSYLNWNRDSVNDEVILNHLASMSGGELKPKEGFTLDQTSDILSKNAVTSTVKKKKRMHKNHSSNSNRPRKKFSN